MVTYFNQNQLIYTMIQEK